MPGLAALDVVIGLVFVYLVLSLICTTINEWVAGLLRRRARVLHDSLIQLLGADSEPFFKHPLIEGLGPKPSYLSSRTFSMTLLDLIGEEDIEVLKKGQAGLRDPRVQATLRVLAKNSGSADELRRNVEVWFESAMDRVSGGYKRWAQLVTVAAAIVVTVSANADTIEITRRLWLNPVLRGQILEEAKARTQRPAPPPAFEYTNPDSPTVDSPPQTAAGSDDPRTLSDREQQLLGALLGWRKDWKDLGGPREWFLRITGWILTVGALSVGAPFWFDRLKDLMRIRSTGRSPLDKPEPGR